jgi:hypothetical protein
MRMSCFCASSRREVVPVEGGANSHVAVAARKAMPRNAKESIVLVFADVSFVGLVLDDERVNVTVTGPSSSSYTFEQQHNGAAPRVRSWL